MLGAFDYQYSQAGFTPRDPLSTAQPPRNPLQPEQFAQEAVSQVVAANQEGKRGRGVGSAARTARRQTQVMTGRIGQNINNMLGVGGQRGAQMMQQAGALFPRQALLGGVLAGAPSLLSAVDAAQEGRSLEAGVTSAVGLGSAIAGAKLGASFGLPGAAVGFIGGLAAPMLGGLAEKTKAQMTGEEIAGAPGSSSAARGQRQKGREEAMKDAAVQAQIAQQYGGAYLQPTLQAIQDLRQNDIDMMIQSEKRLDPIIRQRLNDQLTRQQALMNTQNQNYMQQGVLATAGALATGAQQEAGANLRTALSTNPYAGAIMQAPQIRFG
jgi:hypothetical protein